jgi:collagenase-like PrtC family protease
MAFETLTQAELDSMKINPVAQATPTAEEVQRSYNASMDSVNLLNAGKPEKMTDSEWADTVKRNKEHLEIQIAKGAEYYGSNDLTPFENAVKL